jgi:ABC-type polysaccharide/polyol phosphate transport system ATPase subunit
MLSGQTILRVNGLVKEYWLYERASRLLLELLLGGKRHHVHRVLDGVSFDVRLGEIVGIVGRNGAGKSTLLKVICGVLDYNAGQVEIACDPAPILELGLGFDLEQTGRENIRFGGLCLGMRPADIDRKMNEIIDFSELRSIIELPYRTYSTGQRMRLAFSTAISVDTKLLVVDEALAVADILFQEKCIRRLRDFREAGGTVLFVSHSLQQVYELCTRALLIDAGRIVADGDPVQVGHEYELLMQRARARSLMAEVDPHFGYGNQDARRDLKAYLGSISMVDSHGTPVHVLEQGKRYGVQVVVCANERIGAVSPGFRITLASGVIVLGTSSWNLGQLPCMEPGDRLVFEFWFVNRLAAGPYLLSVGLAIADSAQEMVAERYVVIDTRGGAMSFSVVGAKPFYGVADLVDKLVILQAGKEVSA